MFEDAYRHMNGEIAPERALIEDTLDKLHREKPRAKHRPLRRAAAVCAAVACTLAATPALTAAVPGVYSTLYAVSPAAAQFFIPVRRSCEANGIELAVDSARVREEQVEIFVTLRDLTGSRIDETTDLWDSYSIGTAFGSALGCEAVGYDEATGTKTFRIIISDLEGRKFAGDKVTFSLRELVSGKHVTKDAPIPLDLTALTDEADLRLVPFEGGSFPSGERGAHGHPESFAALVPSGEPVPVLDDITITGAGYAGGELHIQVRLGDRTRDPHGFFELRAADGRVWKDGTDTHWMSYFTEQIDGEEAYTCEYVWKISREELAEYGCLFGSFTTGGTNYKGPWRITFPVMPEGE